MKKLHLNCGLLAIVLAVVSCQKQPDPLVELEKTAETMAKSEGVEAEAEVSTEAETPFMNPSQQVKSAIDDYKAGKMEDAVTRLQLLRAMPALSPQQRMALQDSIAAVMTEIYAMAEQGDPRAKAAIVQYERMQTGR
jgi:hypothetical protein